MKSIFRKLILIVCLFVSFIFLGCTKNVAGPKGETGAAAEKGNMVQTNIAPFEIQSSAWTYSGSSWNTTVFVAEITNDVLKNGEVKVYIQESTEWRSLPFATGNIFTQLVLDKSSLTLQRTKIHDGPPPRPEPTKIRIAIFTPAP